MTVAMVVAGCSPLASSDAVEVAGLLPSHHLLQTLKKSGLLYVPWDHSVSHVHTVTVCQGSSVTVG